MNPIPVLYYHSVSNYNINHPWSFLSASKSIFKLQMNFLKYRGYKTCNWDELYNHIRGTKMLPKKTIFIQFDDGFLDNWTIVFPIMEKLNFKFSVLITPDFVFKSDVVRDFTKENCENKVDDWWGYLSEGEIKKMSKSGLVDFQCHGFTHTWYESSDKILDFYDGNNFYPHIHWNNYISLKYNWLNQINKMKIPKGYPIFEFKKSLELENRFYPNKDFVNECIKNYSTNNDKNQLFGFTSNYKKSKGYYESNAKKLKRINREIVSTRKYIEGLTNKDASYFVFPGGGHNKEVIKILKKNGFKLVSKGLEPNNFNSNLFKISRLSAYHDFKFNYLNLFLNLLFLQFQLFRVKYNKISKLFFKK